MLPQRVIATMIRLRDRDPLADTPGSARKMRELHEEVYRADVTDREMLYGESFACEWCRLSNLSPDDFE